MKPLPILESIQKLAKALSKLSEILKEYWKLEKIIAKFLEKLISDVFYISDAKGDGFPIR